MKCHNCGTETVELAPAPVPGRIFRVVTVPMCRACRGRYYSKRGILRLTPSWMGKPLPKAEQEAPTMVAAAPPAPPRRESHRPLSVRQPRLSPTSAVLRRAKTWTGNPYHYY